MKKKNLTTAAGKSYLENEDNMTTGTRRAGTVAGLLPS